MCIRQVKKRIFSAAAILTLASGIVTAGASPANTSYNYVQKNNEIIEVTGPAAYLPDEIYGSLELGVELQSPEDFCFGDDGRLYMVDSAANKLICFDAEWRPLYEIVVFNTPEKSGDSFKQPTGVCLSPSGLLYVADTGNERILVFTQEGNYVKTLPKPESELFKEGFVYKPRKLAVDSSERIFVVAADVVEGIIELTSEGEFVGFMGSNRVVVSAVQQMWRFFLSEEQIKTDYKFIPVEYTNISLDSAGFLYVVTSAKNADFPIKRLNSSGEDILVRTPIVGKTVSGDLIYNTVARSGATIGPSDFVDIISGQNGFFYALDSKRGRIFVYDEEGNILFVTGSLGTGQKTSFNQPCALEVRGGSVYVLDRERARVVVLKPTEYSRNVLDAIREYNLNHYEASAALWDAVLSQNNNMDIAYAKKGYCLYRMGDYKRAMESFKLAGAREPYARAYEKYRKASYADTVIRLLVLAVAVSVAWIILRIILRRIKGKRSFAQANGSVY